MPDTPLFANRYRIPSARMPKWNYSGNGSYFITMKTNERNPWFGHIQNGIMCVSDSGSIVEQCWSSIHDHFPHVRVDTHIVMPDHIHGILTVRDRGLCLADGETCASHVSTSINNMIPRPPSGSLGSVINQFKSICTKRIRAIGITDFAWQSRFHDHVIRDEWELRRIRQYIRDNPLNWIRK
jgi:putative transposase